LGGGAHAAAQGEVAVEELESGEPFGAGGREDACAVVFDNGRLGGDR
jgi:hypothetical protein